MNRHDKVADKPADIRAGGKRGAADLPDTGKVAQTVVSRDRHEQPKLQHESDQSSSSQVVANEHSAEVMRQAAEDIERGLVDTDRSIAVEPLKREHFPPGDKAKKPPTNKAD